MLCARDGSMWKIGTVVVIQSGCIAKHLIAGLMGAAL